VPHSPEDPNALAAAYDKRTAQLYEARASLAEAVSALTVELRELRERAQDQAEAIARLESELEAASKVIEQQRNMKLVRWTRWPRRLVYRLRGRPG
jgi:predicted  nucleic acid-binding Zn-ribbon protein